MKHKAIAKRLLSSLLVVCMCLSFIPVQAKASESDTHRFTLTTDQETGFAIAEHDCSAGGDSSTVLFTGKPASTTQDGHVTVVCTACGLEEEFEIPMITDDFFALDKGAHSSDEYNGSTQHVAAIVADGSVISDDQVEFKYSDLVAEGLLQSPDEDVLDAGIYSFTYAFPTDQTSFEDSEEFFLFVEPDGYAPVTYAVDSVVVDLDPTYGIDNPVIYEDGLIDTIVKPTFTNSSDTEQEADVIFFPADYDRSGDFIEIGPPDGDGFLDEALDSIDEPGIYTAYIVADADDLDSVAAGTPNYMFRTEDGETSCYVEEQVYVLPSELLPIYVNDELSELEYIPYFFDNDWALETPGTSDDDYPTDVWHIVLDSDGQGEENSTAVAGTFPAILYAYRTDHNDGVVLPFNNGDLDLTVKKRTLLGASLSDVYFVGTIGDSAARVGLSASMSVDAVVSAVGHYYNPLGSKTITCPVQWDFSNYNAMSPYYQTLYGDLLINESWFDLSDEVENPNNVRATAVVFLMNAERAKNDPPDPEASSIYSQSIILVDENPDYDPSLTGDDFLTQEINRVEYGIWVGYRESEDDPDDWHWQSSPVFTGLSRDTTYRFITRYAQDPFTALPGTARSKEVQITTLSKDQALQGPTVTLTASQTSVEYGNVIYLHAEAEHPDEAILSYTYNWFTGDGTPLLSETTDTMILDEISDSGTYYCIVAASNGGDLATGRSNDVTVEITKATPLKENNMPTATGITYGQTLADSTIVPGILPMGGTFEWVDSLTLPSVAESKTRTYQAIFKPDDTEHYKEQTIELSVEVSPAPLTIKAKDRHETYGFDRVASNVPVSEQVECNGFVNMESALDLDGNLVIEIKDPGDGNYCSAGTHQLMPGGVTSENYVITFEPGNLVVDKADLTVKAKDVNEVYGFELDFALDLPFDQVECIGLIGADTFADLDGTLVLTDNGPNVDNLPAGNYTITPSGLTSENYNIKFEAGNLVVEPAEIVLSVPKDGGAYYGDELPVFDYLAVMYVPSIDSEVADTSAIVSPAYVGYPIYKDRYTADVKALESTYLVMEKEGYELSYGLAGIESEYPSAGNYRYIITSPENPNYDIILDDTAKDGSTIYFTIHARPVDVTWEELGEWIYDGKDHSDLIQASFIDISGKKQLCDITFQRKTISSENPETVPFIDSGHYIARASTTDPNYWLFGSPTKEYSILEQHQVLSVEFPSVSGSPEYGTPLSELKLEGGDTDLGTFEWKYPDGFVGSENFVCWMPSGGGEAGCGANATVVFTPTDNSVDFSMVDGYNKSTGTVEKTITIDYSNRMAVDMDKVEVLTKKTYDGKASAAVLASDAVRILEGDDVQLTMTAEFEQSDVGNGLNVVLKMALSGEDAYLYDIPAEITELGPVGVITPAPLIANVSDLTVQYGQNVTEALKTCSVSLKGLMGEDTAEDVFLDSLTYSTTYEALDDIPADTVPITASGTASSNYDVEFVPGQLTVAPTTLTISVADAEMQVGDEEPAPKVSWRAAGQYVIGFEQAVNDWLDEYLRVSVDGNPQTEGEYPYQLTVLPGNKNFTIEEGSIGSLKVTSEPVETPTAYQVNWSGLDGTYIADGTDQSDAITATTTPALEGTYLEVVFTRDGEEVPFQEPGTYTVTAYEILQDGTRSTKNLTNYTETVIMNQAPAPDKKAVIDWTKVKVETEKQYDGTTDVNVDWEDALLVGSEFFEAGNAISYKASFDSPNAGSRTIELSVAVSGPDAEDYIQADTLSKKGTITKAVLDVALDDITVTYGDPVEHEGYKITGFVNGEDESVLSGTMEFDVLYGYRQGMDIPASGRANMIIRSFDAFAENYELSYNVSYIYIEKASAAIDWNYSDSYTETGADQSDTVMASFLNISGERVSLPLTFYLDGVEADGFTDAGRYTVVADTSSYDNNYQFSRTSETIVMGKRDVTEIDPLGFSVDYLEETFYPDNEDQHRFSTDPTFTDLAQEIHSGNAVRPGMVFYGIMASELESGDLSNVQEFTLPERPAAPAVSIDYQAETLLTDSNMEYMGEWDWVQCDGPTFLHSKLGQKMTVRYQATASSFASETVEVDIPNRPDAPSGLSKTDSYDGGPGMIGNLTADMEYSPNNGGSWLPVDGTVIPVDPGMYLIRYAASDASFASSTAAIVIQSMTTEPEDPNDDPEIPDEPGGTETPEDPGEEESPKPDDDTKPSDPDDDKDNDKKRPSMAHGNGLHSGDNSDRWPDNPMSGSASDGWEAVADFATGYSDINNTDWFYHAVNFVVANKLMVGYDSNTWSPDKEMTRSMFITVLYRLAGSPAGYEIDKFQDVSKDSWYYDAVAWAYAAGITSGTSGSTFSPNNSLTYQEMATLIKNFCDYYNMTMIAGSAKTQFDQENISDYAKAAMEAISGTGIMNLNGNTSVDAHGTMTRAEVAQILMNFCYGFYGQLGVYNTIVLI